ncbi:MAG: 3-methylornithine--L-lysine ligase PylC [Chloroflexi bacterium]|nr:MAG: 3-methylornithine--L-lysine ligase PylC [Chloroflexota bacterium]
MRVAVVGGKLQGVEAVYLGLQAGWEVLLIDRAKDVPARGLAHSFIQLDVTKDTKNLSDIFKDMNLIIPALENYDALKSLKDLASKEQFPLAFDETAYAVTSSKQKSDLLFNKLGLPVPQTWPDCGFPVIMKPSGLSGSQGVRKINNKEEMVSICPEEDIDIGNWVIQAFLEGPSFSLEVFGLNGNFRSLQPTIIEVDKIFDCKRVIAPANLSEVLKNKFTEIAVTVAENINLKGIMDIEVILHKNKLKVLEIDARLPSQTPSVVFKSTGINILELLYDIFNRGNIPVLPLIVNEKPVIYEHIRVSPDALEVSGEHIISEARPLHYQMDFFGADEALTDFDPNHRNWVATLILTGRTKTDVIQKHHRVLETICGTFGLRDFSGLHPE